MNDVTWNYFPTDETRAVAAAALKFYDLMRFEFSEYSARRMSELYLRRKCSGFNAVTAAQALADALASRAHARIGSAAVDLNESPFPLEELFV